MSVEWLSEKVIELKMPIGAIKEQVVGFAVRNRVAAVLGVALAAGSARADPAAPVSPIGIDPYYIGSLLSPNPALTKAGVVAIQPTVAYAAQTGAFDANGGRGAAINKTDALQSSTSIRYGITDTITAQFIPTTSAIFGPQGFNSGSQAGDTAIDLDYLLMRGNNAGKPGVTASFGVDLPTGRYENLANASDGFGGGSYRARLGVISQSVFLGGSQHPIRIRVYANGEIPLAGVGLHGFTTFGTDGAFNGFATPGISGTFGAALEYSFTQKFVFAFDIFHGFNAANRIRGAEAAGPLVSYASGAADATQVAPALEYSLTENLGIVAGIAFSVAGHNSSAQAVPQVEFNLVF